MPELREIFEMVATQIEPDQDSWKEQGSRQRRSARNRKLGALALVAMLMAAIALFAAKELIRFKASGPATAPVVPRAPGLAFTVVRLDGTVRSSLGGLPNGAVHPAVSPDGTTVAFTIQNGKSSRIATIRLDGTGLRVLTNDVISADRPRWSPDGRRLVYWRLDRNGNVHQLMVMNADGTNVREVLGTHTPDNQPPDWSPDGSLILYTSMNGSNWGLATIPATGGHSHPLTTTSTFDDGAGTWSPDGHSIAFKRQIGLDWQIWLMNADGSGQHLLAGLPNANAEAPEWSPDGTKIAFIGGVNPGDGGVSTTDAVYVVDVATGHIAEVARGIASWKSYDSRTTWLPDGNSLLVMTKTP